MSQKVSDLYAPEASLTSHVLNLVTGRPAKNVKISLFKIEKETLTPITKIITNDDGRCPAPLLTTEEITTGKYRLEFSGMQPNHESCFDIIPVEFNLSDLQGHYHIPLISSPYGFSTYRGVPPHRAPCEYTQGGIKHPKPVPNDTPSALPPGVEGAGLTIHAIDIARGCGVSNMRVEVSQILKKNIKVKQFSAQYTTAEGRTGEWLIPAGRLEQGVYEVSFFLGEYYQQTEISVSLPPFFERAVVRFKVDDPNAHFHIPLLAAPWGYSVYRGS